MDMVNILNQMAKSIVELGQKINKMELEDFSNLMVRKNGLNLKKVKLLIILINLNNHDLLS